MGSWEGWGRRRILNGRERPKRRIRSPFQLCKLNSSESLFFSFSLDANLKLILILLSIASIFPFSSLFFCEYFKNPLLINANPNEIFKSSSVVFVESVPHSWSPLWSGFFMNIDGSFTLNIFWRHYHSQVYSNLFKFQSEKHEIFSHQKIPSRISHNWGQNVPKRTKRFHFHDIIIVGEYPARISYLLYAMTCGSEIVYQHSVISLLKARNSWKLVRELRICFEILAWGCCLQNILNYPSNNM